jgi:hypothetical protein
LEIKATHPDNSSQKSDLTVVNAQVELAGFCLTNQAVPGFKNFLLDEETLN